MFTNTLRLALAALCASTVLAVPSLEARGADFVNPKTGNRFQILGVAYQPGGESGYKPESGVDALADGEVCLRDAALMQRLGINAIRVYNLSPEINHDACASIFNAVGIYMLIDVNSPKIGESLHREEPWTTYTPSYLNRTFAVVEAFKNYPNTLLFFSGNEVINDLKTGDVIPPYIRAVTRDLKNYVAKHSTRPIPVGYSAADVREFLIDTWNYLRCTTTADASDPSIADIFALNSYSWCGDSSFKTSSYDTLVADFKGTNVPIFFSEYGCNEPTPRIFTEVPVLYGPLMTPVLSGGLVYEYSQEKSNYGLVTINTDGSAKLLADYDTLQKQYNTLNVTALQGVKAVNSTITPPKCQSSIIKEKGFSNNFTIPAILKEAQVFVDNGVKLSYTPKLIPVTTTKVSQVVKQSDGTTIEGLSITVLADDESNTPSGQKPSSSGSSTSSSSSSAASPTASKKSGAGSVQASMGALTVVGLLFAALL
ncbi:1,3-beta-glucanosyltransferase [Venustampulla echinocandica]|uniref:1,3-beta-glucanosyltransferase n=1 Tax=Venustampulla echinocandica TaxID=2656787 RepID=A0A370TP94_9HELO|nr:1,3-beta-glucanosyltransferase [Venustampulla echinocandica]RDL37341.1 1,3-beta-glucanosyltransferase [Venustampulla echinocandica]